MSVSSRLCLRLFAFQPETDAEAAFTERLVWALLRLPRSSERGCRARYGGHGRNPRQVRWTPTRLPDYAYNMCY